MLVQWAVTVAPAEREHRVTAQRARLTGLTHSGVEEVAFEGYNLVCGMMQQQQNVLAYQRPNRFLTRQQELQMKRLVRRLRSTGPGVSRSRTNPALTLVTPAQSWSWCNAPTSHGV